MGDSALKLNFSSTATVGTHAAPDYKGANSHSQASIHNDGPRRSQSTATVVWSIESSPQQHGTYSVGHDTSELFAVEQGGGVSTAAAVYTGHDGIQQATPNIP